VGKSRARKRPRWRRIRLESMAPDGMHPRVLGKLVVARQLLIIFERLWQLGEVPEDWKRTLVSFLSSRRGRRRI